MYVCLVISILWILIVLKLGLDTQKAEDANVVTNPWDGLLSFDRYGKVVPAIASSAR